MLRASEASLLVLASSVSGLEHVKFISVGLREVESVFR